MPTINEFSGEKLVEPSTVAEIKNQTEILLKNKDVAGAFRSAGHLKAELAKLPLAQLQAVLADYRAVSANLKVLALPLLEKDEVKNLLANNLPFVGGAYADALPASLAAWLALRPEAEASNIKEELLAVLPAGNSLSEKIKRSAADIASPFGSRGQVPTGRLNVGFSNVGAGTDELFDADESSELATHAAKVNAMGGSPLAVDNASGIADEILSLRSAPLQNDGKQVQSPPRTGFGDGESFKRRAQALVFSRLRDVRAAAEIRDYLRRPFAVGGLGLSGNGLEEALKLIEREYQKLHSAAAGSAAKTIPVVADQDKEKDEPKVSDSLQNDNLSAISQAPSLMPAAGAASPTPPLPLPRSGPRIMRTAADSIGGKPRLDDIKRPAAEVALPFGNRGPVPTGQVSAAQREGNIGSGTWDLGQGGKGQGPARQANGNIGTGTVGAPDELKLLTLADWRKLGGGPAAINHILEKVAVLDKESLSEKLTAIESFRASEFFREYLNIGRNALSTGRKLSASLADAAVNPNKMMEDEFFAVAELNGKLK